MDEISLSVKRVKEQVEGKLGSLNLQLAALPVLPLVSNEYLSGRWACVICVRQGYTLRGTDTTFPSRHTWSG